MQQPDHNVSIREGDPGNVNLIYILYLLSVIVGITGIVGVIMAYIGRGNGDAIIQSHYTHQIHIFWKGLAYMVAGLVLTMFIVGVFILMGALIWYIIRVVTGMQALSRGEAIANPTRWGF